MLLEHQVLNDKVANFSAIAALFSSLGFLSSSVSNANLSCLIATTFSSIRFLFNFTSLQSFESGQALFLVVFYFRVLSSSLFFNCSLFSEAQFALSFSFLSERLVSFSSC